VKVEALLSMLRGIRPDEEVVFVPDEVEHAYDVDVVMDGVIDGKGRIVEGVGRKVVLVRLSENPAGA
jgi:hypothetical protein